MFQKQNEVWNWSKRAASVINLSVITLLCKNDPNTDSAEFDHRVLQMFWTFICIDLKQRGLSTRGTKLLSYDTLLLFVFFGKQRLVQLFSSIHLWPEASLSSDPACALDDHRQCPSLSCSPQEASRAPRFCGGAAATVWAPSISPALVKELPLAPILCHNPTGWEPLC